MAIHHVTSVESSSEPQLKRTLGRFNMVAMTFSILNTWIALSGLMGLILPTGGSVAFLYGFIFCVICNLCLSASLGELASIWPTAGGQCHYAYMLGTERWKRLAAFTVGWLSIAGWLTLVTAAGYFAAFFITAAAILASNGTYVSESWHVYLIFVAIMVLTAVSNLYLNRILDLWNNTALIWSLTCFLVISIVLLATSEKVEPSFVFAGFVNVTGWTPGIACILGAMQPALALIGADAATHMSEEMPNPSTDTPRAMVYSVGMGGVTGTAFILVILFCLDNVDEVLGTATGMPITELLYRSTGSTAAATILTLALAICFTNGTNAAVTTASRLLYAMARDGGTPAPKFFAKLDARFNVPSRTIMTCFVFNVLFGLLYLGPSVAFSAYTASTTIFLNLSYAAPIVMLLIRGRKILNHETVAYRLGPLGIVFNWIGVLFVIVNSTFLCFPAAIPVDSSNFNYVTAVLGIYVLFMLLTWAITKNNYHGPDILLLSGVRQAGSSDEITLNARSKGDDSKV